MNWQSSMIPSSIRRPWRIFQEDLECKLAEVQELAEDLESKLEVHKLMTEVQERGALETFLKQDAEEQMSFAEISLMELAAYVCWSQARSVRTDVGLEPSAGGAEYALQNAWDVMDLDDKAEWVPEDARATLTAVSCWAPLLAYGPPPCLPPAQDVSTSGGVEFPTQTKLEDDANTSQQSVAVPSTTDSTLNALADNNGESETDVAVGGVDGGLEAPAIADDGDADPICHVSGMASESSNGSESHGACADVVDSKDAASLDGIQAVESCNIPSACPTADKSASLLGNICEAEARAATARDALAQLFGEHDQPETSMLPEDGQELRKLEAQVCNVPNAGEHPTERNPGDFIGAAACLRLRKRGRPQASTAQQTLANPCRVAHEEQQIVSTIMPVGEASATAVECELAQASTWSCSVCTGDDACEGNDLVLCEHCNKAFHQLCHDPPVEDLGSPEDQWFCGKCTTLLARRRGLALRSGDFTWAKLKKASPWWPAVVLRISFSSVNDPKPYWVQFFSPSGLGRGAWLGDRLTMPWSEMRPSTIHDERICAAVKLAQASGAPDPASNEKRSPTPQTPPSNEKRSPTPQTPPRSGHGSASTTALATHDKLTCKAELCESERADMMSASKKARLNHYCPIEDPLFLAEEASEIQDLLREAAERQKLLEERIAALASDRLMEHQEN